MLRHLIAAAVAVVLTTSSSFGQSGGIAVFSYQETSCGTWAESAASVDARAQYHSWFRGFVSGYNFGNPASQVRLARMPDQPTLFLFVDKYCREHPLNTFVGAAFELVKELRDPPASPDTQPQAERRRK